jgi:hypothetical protein
MATSHQAVAHAWANQTGRQRTGFNIYYDGPTIFSYGRHFPIARICDDGETDRPTILFTSKGYSRSTAKHKSYISRAIDHHHYRVFSVNDVLARKPAEHLKNWECSIEDARESIGKAKRARKNASWYIDDAERAVKRCNDYSTAFGLGMSTVTMESLDATAAEIAARAETMRREAEIARAKAEREAVLRNRENLRAWLDGKNIYPPYTKVPYVRVNGDQVETTWGARVPLPDALQAWKLMKSARAERITFEATPDDMGGYVDDSQLRVGDFRISTITPTGMRVGCHFIPFKAAKMAAIKAGIEVDPSTVNDLARWADDGGRTMQ